MKLITYQGLNGECVLDLSRVVTIIIMKDDCGSVRLKNDPHCLILQPEATKSVIAAIKRIPGVRQA